MQASMAASARTTIPPMSRKTAAGWRSRWASRPSIFSACIRPIRPMSWSRTGPWQGAVAAARRRHRHPHRRSRHRRHRGRLRTDLAGRSERARDRRGACGLEGRADRHRGIHRRGHGKTRRRTRRHRRRHRPPDPPALLRSRRRIRRAVSSRPTRRTRCSSFPPRARATRCSISPASSGCGSKTPACL